MFRGLGLGFVAWGVSQKRSTQGRVVANEEEITAIHAQILVGS